MRALASFLILCLGNSLLGAADRTLTSRDTFLAIDDSIFAESRHVFLGMNEARKHPANPIVRNRPDGPDSLRVGFPFSVVQENGRFRAWYLASDGKVFSNCHADSENGVHWQRPPLGLVNYRGSTKNNIVRCFNGGLGGLLRKVWRDDAESDPNRRYKAAVPGALPTGLVDPQLSEHYSKPSYASIRTFASSPDGLHWQDDDLNFPIRAKLEASTLYRMHGRYFMASQMILGEYAGLPPYMRYIGVSSSTDFRNWKLAPRPGFRLRPELGRLVQTHVAPACQNYGNVIVAALGLFYENRIVAEHETDLTLVLSNDGYRWRQPDSRQPMSYLLRRGDRGSWDHSFMVQGSLLNVGDQTFLYYTGRATGGNIRAINPATGIQAGLATLPLDRYGYLAPARLGYNAERQTFEGELKSKPIQLKDAGLRLYLNTTGATQAGDEIKVELQDIQGRPIQGFTLTDCDNVTQDSTGIPVTWRGRASLDSLGGQTIHVRIRFIAGDRVGGRVPMNAPRLHAFYFDTPTLWHGAKQKVHPGRGLERLHFQDPQRPRTTNIDLQTDKPVTVELREAEENKLVLTCSEETRLTLRFPKAQHISIQDQNITPRSGQFSFAAPAGKPIHLHTK